MITTDSNNDVILLGPEIIRCIIHSWSGFFKYSSVFWCCVIELLLHSAFTVEKKC